MSEQRPVRALIAVAPKLLGELLERVLRQASGTEVVGRVQTASDLAKASERLQPDVVLLDTRLPDLRTPCPAGVRRARVLALDFFDGGSRCWEFLRRGALGYLDAQASCEELVRALEAVAGGASFISPRSTRDVIERVAAPAGERAETEITAREREILELVAEGLSSKEIADRLYVSSRTVETHRLHLMGKLQAVNSAHLVRIAIRDGVIGS